MGRVDEKDELDLKLLDTPNELDALLLTSLEKLLEDEEDESAKEDDDLAAEVGRLARLDDTPIVELFDELNDLVALEGPAFERADDDVLLEEDLGKETAEL